MEYWEDKTKPFRLRMNDVFKEQIDYLEKIVPNFKVVSAVSHFDKYSPHLHIVGVPFKEGNKKLYVNNCWQGSYIY
jgi:Plasmid recombination enzyme.